MNAEQILAMAFPDERAKERDCVTVSANVPRLMIVTKSGPLVAWEELQGMLATIPGLDLATDGKGGVWLREPHDLEHFEKAQNLFLKAMPEIEKNLGLNHPNRRTGRPIHVTPPMVRVWRTARAWIFPRLEELTSQGWTAKRLFAAGQSRYPGEDWGLAWSRNWIRPGVRIFTHGKSITWSWPDGPRRTSQTEAP